MIITEDVQEFYDLTGNEYSDFIELSKKKFEFFIRTKSEFYTHNPFNIVSTYILPL